MKKIQVVNVKTGKVSEITPVAWELMKKTGKTKDFDIIENPKASNGESGKKTKETSKKKTVEKIVEIDSQIIEPTSETNGSETIEQIEN